jgi:hypothetical protein
MHRIRVKTTDYKWMLSREFEPKVDYESGVIKVDKQTGFNVHVGEAVGFGPDGAEVFPIAIVAETCPKVSVGDAINVTGLVAMPWLTREKELRISFRADSVTPASATTSIKAAS